MPVEPDDRSATGAATLRETFARDGVVFVPKALSESGLRLACRAYDWSLSHPGPFAGEVLAGAPGAFFQDHANPDAIPIYRDFALESGLARLISDILGTSALWLLYEQIWLKQGAATRRTPWHQDLAYMPMAGAHMATAWITLDQVDTDASLEFVRASHLGPLFNPTAFDAQDDRAAMYEKGVWPALPDIEAERNSFDIVGWGVSPGDVLLFHPAILHGGAPTSSNKRRRTISLRVFGDDTVCASRPEQGVAEIDQLSAQAHGDDPICQLARLPPGSPFRHPAFARLT